MANCIIIVKNIVNNSRIFAGVAFIRQVRFIRNLNRRKVFYKHEF